MQNLKHDHQLVIVGGGVAGLELASALARDNRPTKGGARLHVTLVDRDSAHVWKPMLHTIAAGTRDVHQQQTVYAAHARDAGFTYQPGELYGLDREKTEILVAPLHARDGRLIVPARRIGYDTLVLAVGSQANDFGTPGVLDHCMMIDSRTQADAFNQEIRARLLQCLSQSQTLNVAIVGGGATGVELAAELVQLTTSAIAYGATDLSGRINITLIESGPRLLAAFPDDISAATQARLEALGITVLTSTRVTAATAQGFVLGDGSTLDASLKVWAAGVKASRTLTELDGLEVARGNQLQVRSSLATTLDPHIFAMGDCSQIVSEGKPPLPPTAQVAHQQAQHLIRHLPGHLFKGKPIPDFVYQDLGAIVSLGDYGAFASLGKFGLFKGTTIRGRLAQLGHVMLYRSHQARIHGFWRGGLLWLIDMLNARLRAPIRLD